MRLLHAAKRPDFVALDASAIEISHLLIGEHSAAGPDLDHKPHDRISVRIRHPFGGADRIALDQAIDDLGTAGEREAVHGSTFCHYICTTFTPSLLTCQYICTTILPMKTDTLQIRLQPKEKEAFEIAAQLSGIALSSWVRERLRAAAIRELEGVGKLVPFIEQVPLRVRKDG